jgi:hypothetical protein
MVINFIMLQVMKIVCMHVCFHMYYDSIFTAQHSKKLNSLSSGETFNTKPLFLKQNEISQILLILFLV